jgi:hypothetical protein
MRRVAFGLFCSVVVLSLSLTSEACAQQMHSESPRLKLYVGEIKGDEDLVKSVRAQLVDELTKRGVALVASEEEADATLAGVGVHRTGTRLMFRTRPTVSIVLRGDVQLIARDGRRLWTSDVSSARLALSETASFAEIAASRVAQKLRQMTPQMTAKPERPAA